jgi:hypothetical protein
VLMLRHFSAVSAVPTNVRLAASLRSLSLERHPRQITPFNACRGDF